MTDDKIAEIRKRHEEGVRAGADEDRAYLLAEVERLRAEMIGLWAREETFSICMSRAEAELLRDTLIKALRADCQVAKARPGAESEEP